MAEFEKTKEYLREKWEDAAQNVDADVKLKWLDMIVSRYTEPTRKYHTLSHLEKMLRHSEANIDNIKSLKSVPYAIFFHDIVYDVQSQSNEEDSAKLFEEFAAEAGIDKDEELVSQVKDLILLSKGHCTDAHFAEGVYGEDDSHYFLDFDVSILGADSKEYEEYSDQIREEYKYLSNEEYNNLRTKVLKSFLQIPNIFATKTFRDEYEATARDNIQAEISKLSKQK